MVMTLYTYTHKFNKYPTYSVVTDSRNSANGMLTLWAEGLVEYDGRNCDFDCKEKMISVVTSEEVDAMCVKYGIY